jgi:hypothetical protein
LLTNFRPNLQIGPGGSNLGDYYSIYSKDNTVAGIIVTVLVLTRVIVLQSGQKPIKKAGWNNNYSSLSI